MGRARTEVTQLLGPLDPSAGGESVVSAPGRQADLQRILATADRPAARPALRALPRRRLVLAGAGVLAAVTAVAVGASIFAPAPNPALAVTPIPLAYQQPATARPAAAVLGEIAGRVAHLPAEPRGDYQHLVLSAWHLWTQVDGERVTSAVVPERRESWRAADKSGREVVQLEAPTFRSDADRKVWKQQGSPGSDVKPRTENYRPGEFRQMWDDRAPADVAALKPWLERGHPTANGPAEVLIAATDLVREQVLEPAQRAALLRAVAQLPGLSYDGEVTDRAGRRGQAFSLASDYSGLPTRYTIVVDPATGRLLYSEQVLTTRAGKLNVAIPAVISYETYLKADYSPRPS